MGKEMILKSKINKKNKQISLYLKKKELPRVLIPKLKDLKGIKFKKEDLIF